MAIDFLNTNNNSTSNTDGNFSQDIDPGTVEIHQHAVINILPADGSEDGAILGYILDPVPSEDGEVLVCDINKQEYEVALERIAVYPPHEVLIMMNRYHMMADVMGGKVDPDQFIDESEVR